MWRAVVFHITSGLVVFVLGAMAANALVPKKSQYGYDVGHWDDVFPTIDIDTTTGE